MAKKILVVDDSDVLRRIMRFNLEKAGFTVLEAVNGEEGLEMMVNEKPDLVFLDIMMPKMDGFFVLKRLQEMGLTDIPIIVVTAKGGEDDALNAKRLGAKLVITKPFSPKEIVGLAKQFTE
ncbi:MAG: response regulator [Thermotogae bacterium]|nr:response regulator [Thermotogota bacterium]